jgi:hypothetical protein
MKLKISFIIILSVLVVFVTKAQEETEENITTTEENQKSDVIFGADLVSRYIWRGLDLGSSPAIQPYFFWNIGGFSVGTWGSYGFSGNDDNFAEVDLMVSYNHKYFSIGITDFFFPVEGFNVNNKYFNYKSGETAHAIEGSVKVNGPESFPASLMVGTVFYGADLDANQDNVYSTYVEIMYPHSFNKIDLEFFIGAVLNDEPNLYADGNGVINLGFKAKREIKVSDDYSMGAFISLVTNPKYENMHLVFGLSF